jgi:hypothetical protein
LFGGFGNFDKDTIVDLNQPQELKNFTGLGGNFADTVIAMNESVQYMQTNTKTNPLIRTTKYTFG